MATAVEAFFHKATSTLTYIVWDTSSRDAIVIDPVLDYDARNKRTSDESCRAVITFAEANALTVHAVMDTHAHADHLSGIDHLARHFGAERVISRAIQTVQQTFAPLFGLENFPLDGSQFDRLVGDGDIVAFGSLDVRVIPTPGHTPACVTYLVDGKAFTGDAMFMPDFGTGRCDFPAGDAGQLFDSIQRLYDLPDSTELYVGHDYQPGGRELRYQTTVGEARRTNKQLLSETPREEFVAWRTQRDATLSLPGLIFESIQVNINAGVLPRDEDGTSRLTLPLNIF